MRNIGFIGLGVMGKPMAINLIKNDDQVFIYTRTKESANHVIEQGGIWCESIKAVAEQSDLIITMVSMPSDVDEVYFSKEGLINTCKPGTILIDMTTSTPKKAIEIYKHAEDKGLHALDAPVSGGDIGAMEGTLSIMVGGDESTFNQVKDVFDVLGANIVYQGPSGSGQHTKMVNQIAIAGAVIGVSEALTYANAAGLDIDKVMQSINKGAASSWQLEHNGKKMMHNDLAPGFYIKHFLKDLHIAQEEARKMALDLPSLDLVENIYNTMTENGYSSLGTQAIIKYYIDKE